MMNYISLHIVYISVMFVTIDAKICKMDNEIFSQCRGHCERSCDKPHPHCTYVCIPGCVCKPGYLRDRLTGECVIPEMCTVDICNKSKEFYTTCGSSCPNTCKNYMEKKRYCPDRCIEGCFCLPEYVRDTVTYKCVLPKDCYSDDVYVETYETSEYLEDSVSLISQTDENIS